MSKSHPSLCFIFEQFNNRAYILYAQKGVIMNIVTNVIEIATKNTYSDVSSYSDLIHTYGASTVIIAVFLVVLLVMFGYILRNNQKTNNHLIEQQQELVDMLLKKEEEDEETKTLSSEEQPKRNIVKEPDLVQVFLNINSSLKEILKDISEVIKPSRISIYVFHNGVYSSHGLPFFKTSCICEIVEKNCGVVKNIKSHAGLPLQMFDNSISRIYKNGRMSVCDVDLEDEQSHDYPVLSGMLRSNNIRSASAIAVYDHDNNILGIIIAEFVDAHDQEFLTNVENKLIEKAPLLSPILEYSGIYNNNTTNK